VTYSPGYFVIKFYCILNEWHSKTEQKGNSNAANLSKTKEEIE
jgi:hypothetical protein